MHHRSALIIFAIVVLYATGCSIAPRILESDGVTQRTQALQDLQIKVMRFADEYVGRIVDPITALESRNAAERSQAQNWKISQATSAYMIGAGPSPVTNAVDFVVLATLSHMVINDVWRKGAYGERAAALDEVYRQLETRSWELVGQAISSVQQQQLRALIDDWRTHHPHIEAVPYTHFSEFARSTAEPDKPLDISLLPLLGLDPLSELDPAVREIAQTRHLAERAIYYGQRAPHLLDMQIERLTYQLADMPEMQRMFTAVDQASRAVDRAGTLADKLPGVFANERAATIRQLLAGLADQEQRMGQLAVELRQTFHAGATTSDSLNATIKSFESLLAHMKDASPASEPSAGPSKPFDIAEYTDAARAFTTATRQLDELIRTMNTDVPTAVALTQSMVGEAKAVVDYAFWRLTTLLFLSVGMLLVAALGYRVLSYRIRSRRDE
ncbi:hypothetical protein [Nitrospira lenta]|uniref:Uncharacterized protein n=1 Tax=Nitrospira lenta TaxID=1436998 RepID=A0A330LB15_9BACT|nr:hypothetical protein [Nitrospira lenta]SPP66284.1 hypothetical protein NITLEN_60087 [Nitrospira lenta]